MCRCQNAKNLTFTNLKLILFWFVLSGLRSAYPHHLNADPDPAFIFNVDSDLAFHVNKDLDPYLAHHRSDEYLRTLVPF